MQTCNGAKQVKITALQVCKAGEQVNIIALQICKAGEQVNMTPLQTCNGRKQVNITALQTCKAGEQVNLTALLACKAGKQISFSNQGLSRSGQISHPGNRIAQVCWSRSVPALGRAEQEARLTGSDRLRPGHRNFLKMPSGRCLKQADGSGGEGPSASKAETGNQSRN